MGTYAVLGSLLSSSFSIPSPSPSPPAAILILLLIILFLLVAVLRGGGDGVAGAAVVEMAGVRLRVLLLSGKRCVRGGIGDAVS